jgi:hypothetical protein
VHRTQSLQSLAIAVWVSCLAFEGLLTGMAAVRAWHPHFLPVTPMLALVMTAGLGLITAASWRIARGPGRGRALSWLLIGVAPLWFLAGHFLYGYAAKGERNQLPDPLLRPLSLLGDAVMDIEARFRYPMRTYSEKVVMISPRMPEAPARAQVAAMDRHIRALEARLGRTAGWTVAWARGPILGNQGQTHRGLSLGSRPGEVRPDDGGLTPTDRHEVAHAVIASLCPPSSDPPAVLVEGWAEANMGEDPVEQARGLKEDWERRNGFTLRQLTGARWYHRHQNPVYAYGAPLVDFLLHRFGPEKFLEFYTTCHPAAFDADCRRILGLDVDGLDTALRAEVDRFLSETGSLDRHRLERLRLDPGVNAAKWRAFLADYFTAAARMLGPNQHVRLRAVMNQSDTDAQGRTETTSYEQRLLRSGELASLRHRTPYFEEARLSHPRRSIVARRAAADRAWRVEDESNRTPKQARRRALFLIDILDAAGHQDVAVLLAFAQEPPIQFRRDLVVAALNRFTEGGRPQVRVRIEDRSPAGANTPWHAVTFVLAADDLFAAQTERIEGAGQERATYQSEFTYDRHEGIPVLRSKHTTMSAPDGSLGTVDLKVVERHFGPIPKEEFDPDSFLDGPQVTETRPNPFADKPSTLGRQVWPPFTIGALCLIAGAAIPIRMRRDREDHPPTT